MRQKTHVAIIPVPILAAKTDPDRQLDATEPRVERPRALFPLSGIWDNASGRCEKNAQRGASAVSLIRLTASSANFVDASAARRALCSRASILSRTTRVCNAKHS